VTAGGSTPPPAATPLAAPVLPGLENAPSHAFQRGFAGLAERREHEGHDDFWSWRDRMYDVALRITPDQLRAIAAHLYIELLRGGYTQVCEFHYLQHREDGTPYDDPLTMSWSLADAATDAGIGLTVLPVLYERAGFLQPRLRDDQRRFASNADIIWAMQEGIGASDRPLVNAGLAVHSLRAAAPGSITDLRVLAARFDGPIHIHVAEQLQEVDDCLTATGERPMAWLLREGHLDARWQLVHATHSTADEIDGVAQSGAGVVLCPSTEANLGDGVCDLSGWLAAGVPLSIGSDSNVTRAWREELRLLEYGQRLTLRQRNVSAAPGLGVASTAERLWMRMEAGGGRPAGFERWGLQVGARADLLVVDSQEPALLGMPPARWLDALVFSGPEQPWRDVMVAGRWAVREHRHAGAAALAERFERAMQALWGTD
jgi:formimidoylglutamate deiminase